MNLVNAGLKSKEELKERLEAGEVFYLRKKSERLYYDFSFALTGRSPFRNNDVSMCNSWDVFAEMKKETLWHENIEKPVLCWVSDADEDRKDCAIYIKSKSDRFRDEDDVKWKCATPVTPEDLTKD